MADYEPHPIGDLKTGVFLARPPWMSPSEAWRDLRNAFVLRGEVYSRKGTTLYGKLGTKSPEYADETAWEDASGNVTGQLVEGRVGKNGLTQHQDTGGDGYAYFHSGDELLCPDDSDLRLEFRDVGGSAQIAFGKANGKIMQGAAEIGTWESDGSYSFTFASPITGTVRVRYLFRRTKLYEHPSYTQADNPVLGLHDYYPARGGDFQVALDRRRFFVWDAANGLFVDVGDTSGAECDFLTAGDDDFPFFAAVGSGSGGPGALVITNGSDPPLLFDPSSPGAIAYLSTDFVTPSTNEIDWAMMSFFVRGRLVMIGLQEQTDGTQAQRARWTKTNPACTSAADFTVTDWANAPTTEWPVAGVPLPDGVLVWFERSVWRLMWTDDFRRPFVWEYVSDLAGAAAPKSGIAVRDRALAAGPLMVSQVSSRGVENATPDAPDITFGWDPVNMRRAQAVNVEEHRAALISYPKAGRKYPNETLAINAESGSVSLFNLDLTCFGKVLSSGALTWDTRTGTWDTTLASWDDRADQSGFPQVVFGTADGKVYKLFDGYSDDGSPILFEARTQRLNPYKDKLARLGWIDFYFRPPQGIVDLHVVVYSAMKTVISQYHTVRLDRQSDVEYQMHRLLVNRTSKYHQIDFGVYLTSFPFYLAGMVLWFQPDGDMRGV